jgi:hypothetical protein
MFPFSNKLAPSIRNCSDLETIPFALETGPGTSKEINEVTFIGNSR